MQPITRPGIEKRRRRGSVWWMSVVSLILASLSFLFGGDVIARLLNSLPTLPEVSNDRKLDFWISVATVVVCAVALAYTRFAARKFRQPTEVNARHAFFQIILGWRWIWLSWLLLYLWFGAGAWLSVPSTTYWVVADGLNVLNGFWFFYCFLVLDMPSTGKRRAAAFRSYLLLIGLAGAAVIFVGALGFSDLGDSGSSPDHLRAPAATIVACYTSLSMAYFFGRLDSHHMWVPRLMLMPLYLYVIIQMFWPSFSTVKPSLPMQPAVFVTALMLKIVVFFAITAWLRDGSLGDFLTKAAKDYPGEMASD